MPTWLIITGAVVFVLVFVIAVATGSSEAFAEFVEAFCDAITGD